MVEADESMGADPKYWITPKGTTFSAPAGEVSWLFKAPKTGHLHEGRTYRRHDDVAEAVVCEVAKLLNIPTAQVHLAQRDDTPGVISRNVIRPDHNLRSGDMVLLGIEGYESCAGDRRSNARPGHNLKNIASVMTGLLGPAGTDYADWTAFDVFSGYLLLDALCANNDRHAENWAIEEPPLGDADQPDRLAASFDHGSALASSIEESVCERKLSDIHRFCERGKAKRFEDRKQSLVGLWRDSVLIAGKSAVLWRDRLEDLDPDKFAETCHGVDVVSASRANLMTAILEENRRRILRCSLQN